MYLKPAMIFGDHMVFQRGKNLPVWGLGPEGNTIKATLGTKTLETVVRDGKWRVEFPPMEACESIDLAIIAEPSGMKCVFSDCAVGEVWICGGQSNMEFLLKYDVSANAMYETEDDPSLRYFRYPQANFEGCLEKNAYPDDGFWRVWDTKENRGFFGAIPAFMGRILREKLGCPVGMIGCNWGGTPAAAWASMEEIKKHPEMQLILDWHENALKNLDWPAYYAMSEIPVAPDPPEVKERMEKFMMGEGLKEFMERMKNMKERPVFVMPVYSPFVPGPRACIRPAGLYETMLSKIAPFALRGAIWYQGEDDDMRDWQDFYSVSMTAVVNSWRELFGEPDLPFFQVELAPFRGGGNASKKYPLMREEQRKVTAIPGVYDICIMDLGDEYNIHFRDKIKAGERLALLALRHVYGFDVPADSPKFVSAKRDGDKVICSFDGEETLKETVRTEDTLHVIADGAEVEVKTAADGHTWTIQAEALADAKEISIRYAEENYCQAYLFTESGLPVFPFHFTI